MPIVSRKGVRLALGFPSGVLSLPPLGLGLYFLICWIRIHTTDVYYVDYPYLRTALVFVALGVLCLCCTIFSATRRSFFGIGFAIPLYFGFGTMIYIPDGTPHVQKCLIDDSNFIGSVQPFFRAWYESHHSFPKNKTEFLDALRTGPPPTLSDYSKRGVRLPYEVIVVQNASGPRTDDVAQRPGVIYYWITRDQQRFWVTMTALTEDVSRSASLKMVSWPSPNPYVIAVDSRDYPIRRSFRPAESF